MSAGGEPLWWMRPGQAVECVEQCWDDTYGLAWAPVVGGVYRIARARYGWNPVEGGQFGLTLREDPHEDIRGWYPARFRPVYPGAVETLRRLPPLPVDEEERESCPA